MITIKKQEEIKKYYNKETNTYVFNDDVTFECDINARNIKAWNIDARNINAGNIDAWNIEYYAVCFAYETFKCKGCVGVRENSKHFCLDSEIEYITEPKVEEMTMDEVCKALGKNIKIKKKPVGACIS